MRTRPPLPPSPLARKPGPAVGVTAGPGAHTTPGQPLVDVVRCECVAGPSVGGSPYHKQRLGLVFSPDGLGASSRFNVARVLALVQLVLVLVPVLVLVLVPVPQ